MQRFHGIFEHSLDGKGRLVIPARLRGAFETKKAHVSVYLDRCLAIWTPEQFESHLAWAQAMESHGAAGRNLARILSGHSVEIELDGQWRMTIPPNLREYAGLELDKPLMVVGAINRVELWRADTWKERSGPSLDDLANGLGPLFGEPSVPSGTGAQP